MAKNRNAATIRAIKRRDNRVGILLCSEKGCENEFYLAKPGYPSKRICAPCKIKGPQEGQQSARMVAKLDLLRKLGLVC